MQRAATEQRAALGNGRLSHSIRLCMHTKYSIHTYTQTQTHTQMIAKTKDYYHYRCIHCVIIHAMVAAINGPIVQINIHQIHFQSHTTLYLNMIIIMI